MGTSIVILAGGQSRRMGRDKLRLTLSGEALLERALRRFSAEFGSVRVSTGSPERYPELGSCRIFDRYPGAGPLAGLHAALAETGEDVFLVGGDMPLASPEAAKKLIALAGDCDACVPTDAEGRWEPLFGFYRQRILPEAEALLCEGKNSMAGLLKRLKLREAALSEIGETADLLRNMNDPAEYAKLCLELGE